MQEWFAKLANDFATDLYYQRSLAVICKRIYRYHPCCNTCPSDGYCNWCTGGDRPYKTCPERKMHMLRQCELNILNAICQVYLT